MLHRGDRTTQLERLARLADGPRAGSVPPGTPDDPTPTARASVRRRIRVLLGRLAPFGTGVLAVLVALALYGAITPREVPLSTSDVDQRVEAALASQIPGPPFSALAFGAIAPSLVLIETSTDRSPEGSESGEELGSGVLVSTDGDILTALHVVKGADTIALTFANGSTTQGVVVEERPDKDTAVIRANELPEGVAPAVLGDPRLPVGSEAYAVGSPYGLFGSLSAGVISGHERTFRLPDTDITVSGLIQFDAAVNPGNSGGPLLDRGGRVIGIVIALLNPTSAETFAGIGLAVPIDAAGGDGTLPPY